MMSPTIRDVASQLLVPRTSLIAARRIWKVLDLTAKRGLDKEEGVMNIILALVQGVCNMRTAHARQLFSIVRADSTAQSICTRV